MCFLAYSSVTMLYNGSINGLRWVRVGILQELLLYSLSVEFLESMAFSWIFKMLRIHRREIEERTCKYEDMK